MVGPIKPGDVTSAKVETFPSVVFDVFNELITQNFFGNSATVKQDDVVKLLVEKGLNREDIFAKGWLNIEDVYRKEGWRVEYDKPGFNESYPATFKFSKK